MVSPTPLEGEKGFKIFSGYLDTWRMLGLDYVQFNVIDKETLRKAQQEPEKFPNLLVRVVGYSAYFVELNKETQDSIIARTQHALNE